MFSYGAAAASICGCSSTSTQHTYLLLRHSIFAGPLGSAPSPVIGRLCAFPELQFWRPITGEEAEPSS
ncbi:unnamed protein product, partial [Staurois parvus]